MSMRALIIGMIAAVALQSACGSKKITPPPSHVVPEIPVYDKAVCKYQPYEGNAALYSNIPASQVIAEPAFGKLYDRADLDAVLNASATETSFFTQQLGVTVYKVPRTRGCPTFYVLPDAPEPLQRQWDEIAGGSGEGQLAGLYFENCSGCPEWEIVQPTIMVHESADRWTLVHEMMHHNFNVQRKANRIGRSLQQLSVDINAGIQNTESLLNSYTMNENKNDLQGAAEQVDQLVVLFNELLVNGIFEEMALESLLLDEKVEDRLMFVSDESAISAAWYIDYARKEGMRRFDAFNDVLRTITEESREHAWVDIVDMADRTKARINEIDERTNDIANEAKRKAGLSDDDTFLRSQTFKSLLGPLPIHNLDAKKGMEEFERGMNALNEKLIDRN